MLGRRPRIWVGMAGLAVAAGVLSLEAWGGGGGGGLAFILALVLAGSAVAFLGSPDRRPIGLLYIPLVAGLVLVAIPALGTGYRFGAEMAAAGLLLLVSWGGLRAAERWELRRAASDLAARDRMREGVCEDLARARRLLPPPADSDRLARLDGFVLRGELEAALGELEALGGAAEAPAPYWRALASAAGQMGLAEAQARLARLGGETVSATGDGRAAPGASGGGDVASE